MPLLTLLFVLAVGVSAAVSVCLRRRRILRRAQFYKWLAAYIVFCVISMAVFGISVRGIAYGLGWIVLAAAMHQICLRWYVDDMTSRAVVALLAFVGLLTLVTSYGMLLVPANPNLTAMILVPGGVLGVHFAVQRKSAFYALCAALILCALIFAGRRSGVVALFIGISMLVGTLPPNKRAMAFMVGVCATTVVLLSASLYVPNELASIYGYFAGTVHAYNPEVDGSDLRRAVLTWQALEVFRNSPLLGIGFGRYLAHVGPVSDEYFVAQPHNILLTSLAETGLIGTAVFLIVIALPAWHGWKIGGKGSLTRAWTCCYIAVCVYLLGNEYIHSPGFWPVLAALWSIAAYGPAGKPDSCLQARALKEPLTDDHRRKAS